MRITHFNDVLEDSNQDQNCVIILSRTETYRLIQNLLQQLEKPATLADFISNEGVIYFAVRPDSEAEPK